MRSSMIDKVDNQLRALASTISSDRLERMTQQDDTGMPSNYVYFYLNRLPDGRVVVTVTGPPGTRGRGNQG